MRVENFLLGFELTLLLCTYVLNNPSLLLTLMQGFQIILDQWKAPEYILLVWKCMQHHLRYIYSASPNYVEDYKQSSKLCVSRAYPTGHCLVRSRKNAVSKNFTLWSTKSWICNPGILFFQQVLFITSYFLLLTSYFLLLTSYFLLLTSYFLLLTSYFLLLTFCELS